MQSQLIEGKKAAIAKYKSLIKDAEKLSDETIEKILKLLEESRLRIANAIVTAERFDLVHLQRMKDAVNQAIADLEVRAKKVVADSLIQADKIGVDGAIQGLVEGGVESYLLPRVAMRDLAIMSEFSADLIKGITEEAKAKINAAIQLGVVGEKTANEVMQEIGTSIGQGRFSSIAARAEAITRTEISRVMNLAEIAEMREIGKREKGLKKYWIATDDDRVRPEHLAVMKKTHPDYGGKPIPFDEMFDVGGFEAEAPLDPALPPEQSINCRCTTGLIFDDNAIDKAEEF